MEQPRFTIVTPNHNTGHYLAETIESVLLNLREGDEYYIIDGDSNDCSLEIIRQYESRLTGWVSERDFGYADAIAKGFQRGSGELLAWLNASDLLLPGALDCARRMLVYHNAELIFGDDYYIDENGVVIYRNYGGARNLYKLMLYGGWTPLQDACFWRRSLYQKVGGLNPKTSHAADFELFLKMVLEGKYAYVPVAFSAFRRHPGQVSIRNAKRYRKERQQILRRLQSAKKSNKALCMVYCIWIRLRARIFQPFWNSRSQSGEVVSALVTDCPVS